MHYFKELLGANGLEIGGAAWHGQAGLL